MRPRKGSFRCSAGQRMCCCESQLLLQSFVFSRVSEASVCLGMMAITSVYDQLCASRVLLISTRILTAIIDRFSRESLMN